MANLLTTIIETEEHKDFRGFITFVMGRQERIFLRPQILQLFRAYCRANTKSDQLLHESSLAGFVGKLQELFLSHGHVVLLYRYAIAKYKFYLVRQDGEYVEEIGLSEYLNLKDDLALERSESNHRLRLDFLPFYDFSPSIRDIRSVGNGIRFLNRYMSSNIFSRPAEWNRKMFKFLQLHQHNGRQLLVNGGIITNQQVFYEETQKLLDRLGKKDPETPFADVEAEMSRAGFEVGWGNTVGRIAKTLQIILDLINEPTDQLLEEFVTRVPLPLISRVAVISPHGWFGQTNAFGKPDTGGQVIYILDQVRALERHLQQEIALTGLEVTPKIVVLTRLIPEAADTTCNQRMEKIFYTDNGWILRVPFRDRDYNVVKEWVSRFKIWPYLETFADDAERELASEFSGRPDLIIGNYSDGNLVASLLSDRFDVIQCTIAHALEKTKYQFSDIRWSEYESDYSFSIQYTADLFSMNKSDFIIASTLQEIIGTEETMGQYESYRFFTMPDLYQVINGTNLFAPKFNVIPPGVDEEVYFPYYNTEKRIEHMRLHLEDRLFCAESEDIFGKLDDPAKPCIFTMARLDKIKNITGLIAAFGGSKKLRKAFNLVFSAGTIHPDRSSDSEERKEIVKAYELIDRFELTGGVRWLPSFSKLETGEVYRIIADHKGLFVQPALFEAFGLTVIESMASGLPTFAPEFGGPLEIIEDGKSGFLLDTSKPELIAQGIESIFDRMKSDKNYWKEVSENGIQRVGKHFNWKSYSQRLVNLTKLYGFWRYAVSGKGMVELDRYCDLIYHFLVKERARRMETELQTDPIRGIETQ